MTKDILEKEVANELEKLAKMTPGTKEHTEATEAICKLKRLILEDEKAELEREKFEEDVKLSDRREANAEVYHEEELVRDDKKQRDFRIKMIVDAGIAALGIGVNILAWKFYKNRFYETLIFEEKGSIASIAGKNLVNKMGRLLKD